MDTTVVDTLVQNVADSTVIRTIVHASDGTDSAIVDTVAKVANIADSAVADTAAKAQSLVDFSTSGQIFMVASWLVIIGLCIFCFSKVLGKKDK